MVPFPCWSSRVLNVRPAANINETDAYAPFRRTFYAVSDGQGPPGRSSADWLQKPASSAAPTDTALRLFQSRPCYLSPTEQQRISRAPPLQPRRGPHVIPAAAASAPAAARTRQREQADKRRRAISLRLPCRLGGGQGYIPQKAGRESVCRFCSAMPPFQKRPCGHPPANPAERRHKKRPDKHRCPILHWISVARPAFTAPRRRRRPSPAFGKRQSQSRKTPQLGRFAFSQPRVEGRGEIRAFERRRTAA